MSARTRLLALVTLAACQAPPGDVRDLASCVGVGAEDQGADGIVDVWTKIATEDGLERTDRWMDADPTVNPWTEVTYDARGFVVEEVESYDVSEDDVPWDLRTVYDRDDAGRALTVGYFDHEGGTLAVDTWTWSDDGLLEVVDRVGVDPDVPSTRTEHTYDDWGRPTSVVTTPGFARLSDGAPHTLTWSYVAPAPSLDAHLTVDIDTNGVLETEGDETYDADGRLAWRELTSSWDGASPTTTEETWRYDAQGREIAHRRDREGDVTETHTVWYADDRPLEVTRWSDADGDGEVDTIAEREAWSWACTP